MTSRKGIDCSTQGIVARNSDLHCTSCVWVPDCVDVQLLCLLSSPSASSTWQCQRDVAGTCCILPLLHRHTLLLASLIGLCSYLTEKDGCYWFCAGDSLAPSDTFPKVVSHEHACALLGSVYMLPTVSGMSLRGGLFFSKTTPVSLKGVVFR